MTYKWNFLSVLSLYTFLRHYLFFLSFLCLLWSFPLSVSLSASSPVNYKFNFGENIQTLEQKIQVACSYFDCNSDQLIRVMQCESKGKNISNPSGIHSGIFQYTRGTWANFSQKSGIPNADIWDTDAQIYTTAWAFSNGLKNDWSCK